MAAALKPAHVGRMPLASNPDVARSLQEAVRSGSYEDYQHYSALE
ncbi:hypothetical protein [Alishewanella longhuensis]